VLNLNPFEVSADKILSFAMATHSRLGGSSTNQAFNLPSALIKFIFDIVNAFDRY
jgi:hypothetical protein